MMIKRYNNLFIYECGTRWQVSSQNHALAPLGRAMYVPQGHPIPFRQTCGTRWQVQAHMIEKLHHRDTMEIR